MELELVSLSYYEDDLIHGKKTNYVYFRSEGFTWKLQLIWRETSYIKWVTHWECIIYNRDSFSWKILDYTKWNYVNYEEDWLRTTYDEFSNIILVKKYTNWLES